MKASWRVLGETACPWSATHSKSHIRPFSEIPGPREVPVIGSLSNLNFALRADSKDVEKYENYLIDLHRKYGPIVRQNLGFGRKYVVHVFDPVDAQTVFSADGKTPYIVPLQETTQKYREMRGMNPGLGNLNGPEWYRLRSAVQHAMMRPQSVQTYQPFSKTVARTLVEHIRDEQKMNGFADMGKIAGRWSLESAGQILFERSLGSMGENVEWADMLIDLNKRIFQLSAKMRLGIPIFRVFPTRNWKKMVELEDVFYDQVDRLMNEALDKLGGSGNLENLRFASYLISRKELTRTDIKVILLSMFSDGLSTTAPMLIYNLFNIARHPDVQRIIREELKNSDSPKMPYLRACVKETFRMFPIGTEISRITQKDLILGGFEVPAGTAVDINTNVLMKSNSIFEDSPREFKPSRWLEKSKTVHPFAFLPFGFGPRMCAGRRFAEQDLHTTLASLVANFEIGHDGEDVRQIYETLLLPKGDCRFTFRNV